MKFLTIILYKHLPPHKHIKPLIGLCRRCTFRLFQIDATAVFGIMMASAIIKYVLTSNKARHTYNLPLFLKDTQGYLSSLKIDF